MGWDRKARGGTYYYRSERRPGQPHPVKVYLGRGEKAEAAAREVEERRRAEQAARELFQGELRRMALAEQALVELDGLARLLVQATLLASGFHQHRGQWRRRRDCDDRRG